MKWNEVKWGEMKWNEVKWSEMKWNEVKWSEMKWNEVKWSEMKWNEVKWSEMKWNEGKWREMKGNEGKWRDAKAPNTDENMLQPFEEPSCTGYIRVTLAKQVIPCSGFVTACSPITEQHLVASPSWPKSFRPHANTTLVALAGDGWEPQALSPALLLQRHRRYRSVRTGYASLATQSFTIIWICQEDIAERRKLMKVATRRESQTLTTLQLKLEKHLWRPCQDAFIARFCDQTVKAQRVTRRRAPLLEWLDERQNHLPVGQSHFFQSPRPQTAFLWWQPGPWWSLYPPFTSSRIAVSQSAYSSLLPR